MEHDIKFLNAKEAVATANLDLDIRKDEYAQIWNLEKMKNKGNLGESIPYVSESLVAAKSAYEKAKQAVDLWSSPLQQKEQCLWTLLKSIIQWGQAALGKDRQGPMD